VLRLARARTIDLTQIPLPALVDQLTVAIAQAPPLPLSQKADWLVMAAWLLLRSHLLLPSEDVTQQQATAEAGELRDRLTALAQMQALVRWLDRRLVLGRDVFARGQPEGVIQMAAPDGQIDVITFLWACLDVFGDTWDKTGDEAQYAPTRLPIFSVAEAQTRIRVLLAASATCPLTALLPEPRGEEWLPKIRIKQRRRSALCSVFAACLELGKQGEVAPSPISRLPKTARKRWNMTKRSTASAAKSRTCSPSSKTGDASPHAMTAAPIPSSRPSASRPQSPSISRNES
jgi:segregation and condensation protein A